MAKFYAFMAYLHNEMGHQHIYQICFREAVQKLGHSYCGLLNKNCTLQEIPKAWVKCLAWEDQRGLGGKIVQLFRKTATFHKIFRRKAYKEQKIFFLETLPARDLLALAFASLIYFRKQDYLLLLFRFDYKQTAFAKRIAYAFSLKILHLKLKDRLIFLTDSELVALKNCHLLPVPHAHFPNDSKMKTSTPFVLWWPGEPREEKGKKEILALASTFCADMHLYLSETAKSFLPESKLPLVFLNPEMSRSEFLEQLTKSDVLLLPYDPKQYATRTSGLFIEAITAGKIALVKEGSWLANELKKFQLEELIFDWERKDLFLYIREIIHNPFIREKLALMQKEYKTRHSLENFTLTLKEILKKANVS